jgi:hypothetical protein
MDTNGAEEIVCVASGGPAGLPYRPLCQPPDWPLARLDPGSAVPSTPSAVGAAPFATRFEVAGKRLGVEVINMSVPMSSTVKGGGDKSASRVEVGAKFRKDLK